MPLSRLLRKNIDGRRLIVMAASKAGDLHKLADIIGYSHGSLIAFRNTGVISRKLEKVLQIYLSQKTEKDGAS